MSDTVDRLRADVYAEVFDGLVACSSSRESVNAQAARRTDNIMKHVAYHATRWIPVSERLPPVGVEVLASENGGAGMLVAHRRNDGHWYGARLSYLSVTHWMLVPEPPTTVTEQT